MTRFRIAFWVITGCIVLGAPAPGASIIGPTGTLDVANCSGGGVTVNATSIDWLLPVGGGVGCILTGATTDIMSADGMLGPGVQGDIKDLAPPPPPPDVINFMTFVGFPTLHFDLAGLGPGSNNTACSSTFNPNNPSCSVFVGSPIILTPNGTGTTATLAAFGTATDSSGLISAWIGAYTTQLPGISPATIQSIILAGNSLTNTYSGAFEATFIPEPVSLLLIGGGLIGLAILRKSKRFA